MTSHHPLPPAGADAVGHAPGGTHRRLDTPRELIVLGTASQAPTRERNHNGYVLRWDGDAILFDPGEGTQRQMLFAGVRSTTVSRICITHFHGDHCLGLPGVLQRRELDQATTPATIAYPASGESFLDALLACSATGAPLEVRRQPIAEAGVVATTVDYVLSAALLDHRIEAVGWRLVEPDGVRLLPDRLEALGIRGADVGILKDEGSVVVGGRRVALEEVAVPKRGQKVAVVMDTRWCDAALELATDADLLLCEATFADRDAALAERYRHLTAGQAGRLAAEAGVRRLVLTHFSQRYADAGHLGEEARRHHPDVVVARDLDRIPLPPRP